MVAAAFSFRCMVLGSPTFVPGFDSVSHDPKGGKDDFFNFHGGWGGLFWA